MAKILLVEDDKSLREIYGLRLQAEGYTIISAGDGEEALAVAIKERPDLIVSDVMMPKISGFDMLDILRSTTETKDIKVIMMTALSSEDQRARGESLGADRYLVKSQVGIEDVVRTVHEVMGDSIGGAAPAAAPLAAPAPVAPLEPLAPAPLSPAPLAPAPMPDPMLAAPLAPMPAPLDPVAAVAPIAPLEPLASIEPLGPLNFPEPAVLPAFEPLAPAPMIEPAPVAMPAPLAPAAPMTPAFDLPAPAPIAPAPAVALPQPTAPFSSDPPASLGDRVLSPLPSASDLSTGPLDIAAQMSQALNTTPPAAAPVAPQQPPVTPLPPQPGI